MSAVGGPLWLHHCVRRDEQSNVFGVLQVAVAREAAAIPRRQAREHRARREQGGPQHEEER